MSATIFEFIVIIYTILLAVFMIKRKHKNVLRKMAILFIGVLLFEIISEPMWLNTGFDSWAYIYRDITWVMTLAWVSVFLTAIMLVDYGYGRLPEKKRFWLYLLIIEAIYVPIEAGLIQTGVRAYAPVLTETMTGFAIPLTSVPLEAIYAIPIFTALILSFYKYVNYLCEIKDAN